MATPHFAVSETYTADTEFMVRRGMTKGFEYASLLVPPTYVAFVLARRGRTHLSINNVLRATWLGGATGIALGGVTEYVRSSSTKAHDLQIRRIKSTYNANDHATIGALLFALLTPAIFWKRAATVHLIFGGAGLGAAVGTVYHHVRNLNGDPAPPVILPELPVPSS